MSLLARIQHVIRHAPLASYIVLNALYIAVLAAVVGRPILAASWSALSSSQQFLVALWIPWIMLTAAAVTASQHPMPSIPRHHNRGDDA